MQDAQESTPGEPEPILTELEQQAGLVPAATKKTAAGASSKTTTPGARGATPTAKKATAKKATAKKATAKKATAKKATAKKATAKKATAKAAVTKRAGSGSRGTAARPLSISEIGRKHPYRTVAESQERGIGWRTSAPLDGMAEFDPAPDRPNPLDILRAQDDTRIPELIPIRYGRMSASAFAFYRGSAAVMAQDLAPQPRTPGGTQLCGDGHISNFGFFASPERDLVFDVNDFDETLPGPFEWDVKRLVASVVLAGRDRGFKKKQIRAAAVSASEGYRTAIQRLTAVGNLDVWYFKVDAALIQQTLLDVAQTEFSKQAAKRMKSGLDSLFDKSRKKTSLRAAEKLTEVVDGRRVFRNDPPLLVRQDLPPSVITTLSTVFEQYKDTLNEDRRRLLERYEFLDIALKVVGVGSVGTRAFVMLLHGRDPEDLLILQAKQASESVLEQHLRKSEFDNHGRRVVEGQRYMQAASDIFLGWARGPGADFYLRQLHDMKGSVDLARIQADGLNAYARLCGATLARAHARGGDVVAIASYLGEDDRFARAVAQFGEAYADQAERDYDALKQAIASGEVKVQSGI